MILGVDEVGRGSWAGPLVVGAVVLGGVEIVGLTDSKKLSRKKREELDIIIRSNAQDFGLGWVDSATIDEIGLAQALCVATKQAVEQIKVPYHEIIIDGTVNFLAKTNKEKYTKTLKQADLLIPSVSAASIIAKVARDKYMASQDNQYPEYGFKNHVGYGTIEHRNAIGKLGATPLHRLSFKPLQGHQNNTPKPGLAFVSKHLQPEFEKASGPFSDPVRSRFDQKWSWALPMQLSSKQIGDKAEDIAAKYLKKIGYKILDRNWKTKYCEIDIITRKNDEILFCEVKYRKNSDQGGGLSAITPTKLKQMQFAAKYYMLTKNNIDVDLRLAVISLYGNPPVVEYFLKVE